MCGRRLPGKVARAKPQDLQEVEGSRRRQRRKCAVIAMAGDCNPAQKLRIRDFMF